MNIDGEFLSLVALFDDEDKFVKEAVLAKLLEDGPRSLELVGRIVANESNPASIERYNKLSELLKREVVFTGINADVVAGTLSLEEGIYSLGSLVGREVDSRFSEIFNSDVTELLTEISDERTEVENIEIFNHIFFKRLRFTFSQDIDFSFDNTIFQDVVSVRRGNPVVISVLYFLYASRAGLNIFPLTFPGGFLPVLLNSKGKILFYLNLFKEGDFFLDYDLKRHFQEYGLSFDSDKLVIKGDKYLLAIYAEALRVSCLKSEDYDNAEYIRKIIGVLGENIPI